MTKSPSLVEMQTQNDSLRALGPLLRRSLHDVEAELTIARHRHHEPAPFGGCIGLIVAPSAVLLKKAGGTTYVSGPSAKDYILPLRFESAGIKLLWRGYDGYPTYPQFYGEFQHGVTILDLLFHVGPDAPQYIWGWRASRPVVTT